MKTKPYVRFLNRVAHYDADIEIADVFSRSLPALHTAGGLRIFDAVDPTHHPRLAARVPSPHNRRLALSHLKSTLYSSFLKDLYEDVSAYLTDILAAAARHGFDPKRLVGDVKVEVRPNDILTAGNWKNVVELVAQAIFRGLENRRNTKELLTRINSTLDLGVQANRIKNALPYLEMRHLLVHKDGIADSKFCDEFPTFCSTGQKLQLDYLMIQDARRAVTALVEEFDNKVVAKGIVSRTDMQP